MNAGPPLRALPLAVVRYLRGEESVASAAQAFEAFINDMGHRRKPVDLVPYAFSDTDPPKMHALYEAMAYYGIERDAHKYLSMTRDKPFDQKVQLLAADVGGTLGEQYLPIVWSLAGHVVELANEITIFDPIQKCVDDVQQHFQDTFVDTTWPACPLHPNHPLEYEAGTWRCPRDRAIIAPLGELGGIAR